MIRLLIADDDILIRESLRIIIGTDADIEVIGTVQNGKECIDYIKEKQIDIILLDVRMPIMDGIEVLKYLEIHKLRQTGLKILVLTTFDEDEHIRAAIANGASGFLLKNSTPDKIIAAIKSVALGNGAFETEVINRLNTLKSNKHIESYGLSNRELEIVDQIAKGLSNKEIACKLFISEGTVKNYITSILSKMNLKHRTQIAIAYLNNM
ncbi:response regulator [Cellulosilyticum sp. I15G10I2]|uniref:response regulator n=1 Tax=Cellulosilyticum sp. I15G10I2 TaxID=1892843 RepID=UPI0009F5848F|nr:response regulator transcription factor [Cellulosilyticum sp. I15G10I2]